MTKKKDKSILEQVLEAQAKSLVEFGYPDVTADMVRAAHEQWLRGEEPSDIIAMFCVEAFKEHPMIFGKPA